MALNDLNQMFSIVDPDTGKPTDYLMRLLRDRGIDVENIEEVVAELQEIVNTINNTVFGTGTGLSGGGILGTNDPINYALDADIDDLNDVDTTTAAPTDGQVLTWSAANSRWEPADSTGGSGGGGGAWTYIGEVTADGTSGTLTYDSIPGDYVHIMGIARLQGSASTAVSMRFNNDSSSIYDRMRLYGGSTLNDDLVANAAQFTDVTVADTIANRFEAFEFKIYDYADTTKHKNMHSKSGTWTSGLTLHSSGLWKSTAAVTRIDLIASSGNLQTGSKIQLWGLSASSGGGGGSAGWTKYEVATPGDAFIDVPLDTDAGTIYDVRVAGDMGGAVNAEISVRYSDDNGSSFYSSAGQYISVSTASDDKIRVSNGSSGDRHNIRFTIEGLNTVSHRPTISGNYFGITTGGVRFSGVNGCSKLSLAAGDYNAFRVLCSSGNMNNMAVWVQRIE